MKSTNLFLALLLTAVAACGGGPESVESQEVPANATTALESEADGDIGETSAVVEGADAAEAALNAVEESGPDDAEEIGDKIVLAATEPDARKAARTDWKYSANQHFTALTAAQGTSSAPDKIEVAEVFWYGCSHCYNFDPIVEGWQEKLPADVSFIRLPVMWNPTNEIHARIFYAADALGKLDEMHDEIFKEIHISKNMLTSESEIEKFFARFDVSEDDFTSAFRRSPSVEKNISRARNLTKRYGIQSVPILVVNGKYVVSGPGIKDFNDLISVAEELAERERQER